MEEIWVDIKGWENMYQVSNLSRVRSLNRKVISKSNSFRFSKSIILNPTVGKIGYPVVGLSKEGYTKYCKVHRIVAENFIPNNLNKSQVNHINGIKTDNRICNLEWVTSKENIVHAVDNKLLIPYKKGEGYWVGKTGLNNPKSKKVVQIKSGCHIAVFDSLMDVERQLGLLHGNVGKACRNNKYSCGGFNWEYLNN